MGKIPGRVELLAPAGSREAFEGAVSAGADAVYLGGERFGARAYADNFSTEEIQRAIREAHILDRKVYLTANILTRETEIEELIRFVQTLYEAGLDGVIVQDIGVLAALSQACPGLPLHASTQLSVTSSEAVQVLRRFGVRRVVPARELSLEEIRLLRREDLQWIRDRREGIPAAGPDGPAPLKEHPYAGPDGSDLFEEHLYGGPDEVRLSPRDQDPDPIEIEAFIHGAMCYSYSGRCLMSSFLGGRSGNRGRCAGTCRLPYRVLDGDGHRIGPDAGKKEVYPLSMKDLCVLPILPELIDAGITSFKIEGRMKQPVYAAGVTAIYRRNIDRCYAWMEAGRPEPWRVEEEDLARLRSLYIRTSLGTGYYHTRNGRSLVTIGKPGYGGTDAGLEKEIRQNYLSGLPKKQITGRAVFRIGQPAELFVRAAEAGIGQPAELFVKAAEAGTGQPADLFVRTAEAFSAAGPRRRDMAEAAARGPVVQAAGGSPLEPEAIRARLRKTGGSMFAFSALEIEADENVFLPVSAINALRRDALQRLEDRLLQGCGLPVMQASAAEPAADRMAEPAAESREKPDEEEVAEPAVECREKPATEDVAKPAADRSFAKGDKKNRPFCQQLWALVSTPGQMRAAREAGCACILIDGGFCPESPEGVSDSVQYFRALPPVFRVSYRETLRKEILEAEESGFSGVLVRTLEELAMVRQAGYGGQIIADASLYAWNGRSLAALARDCHGIVAPLELEEKGIRDAALAAQAILLPEEARPWDALSGSTQDAPSRDGTGRTNDPGQGSLSQRLILPVYGRIPMMESAGCIRKTENLCSRNKKAGKGSPDSFWYLEDRMGKHLPVRCRCSECSNTIYNAVPLSLHQFAGRGLYRDLPVHLCMFTTESGQETAQILRFFQGLEENGGSLSDGRSGKRKKAGSGPDRHAEKAPFKEFTNGHFRTGAI